MFTIIKRRELNPTVTELWIHAPLIAKKAKAGQFIIVRAKEDSERIPLTIAGYDREAGTVSIIFQIVGAGTMQLNSLKEGEAVHDFVGPLGKATEIEGLKNVCVVGGGVGCAIALPVAQALHEQGTKVTGIVGFRNKDLRMNFIKRWRTAEDLEPCTGCTVRIPGRREIMKTVFAEKWP